MSLGTRHPAPFQWDCPLIYLLGADALGRPVVACLVQAAGTTMAISVAAVTIAMTVGTAIGLVAGMSAGRLSAVLMRGIDVLLSISSLLLVMVVLFALGAHPVNEILILAVTRLAVFARTMRGESLEIRERAFVPAARVMGASGMHLLRRHVTPLVMPTVLAIAALEFAVIMLAESALTFLGIGIQPPDVTWGLMVAEGQPYLSTAWWVSLWPGLAISSIALAATLVGSWFRVADDPTLRTRLGRQEAQA